MIGTGTGALLASLGLFFAGIPLSLRSRKLSYLACLLGSLALLGTSLEVLAFHPVAPVSWIGPLGTPEGIGLDGLSAFFALVASLVWIATSLFSLAYDTGTSRLLAPTYSLTLGAIALLFLANDAILFLVGWELMTVASYGMILQAPGRPGRTFSAAFIFLAFGEGSTLAIFLALAGLWSVSGTFRFVPLVSTGLVTSGIFLAALVGFGLKMGVAPFHMSEWLPIAHSSAPSNASAVLSATLTLAGTYGLFRILSLLGPSPSWWGAVVLTMGATSALLGALFAAVSEHSKGLPAYSTIENNGLVLVALGVALMARSEGLPVLFAFALYAAFYQALAHAVAKAALFLHAGYIDRTTGTFDLNAIRGRAKEPGSPAFPAFLVAGTSLAAGPPLAGFVSEWMILEALFQSYRFPDPLLRLVGLLAGAAVALAAGLIAAAMVKFLGFGMLWNPRRSAPARMGARALASPILGISAVVAGIGISAPWILAGLGGPAIVFARASVPPPIGGALSIPEGWSIVSGAPFGIISPPGLPLALLFGALVGIGYLWLRGRPRWRRSPPWMAGNPVQVPDESYSAFAFSTGLRLMLRGMFRTREARTTHGPTTWATLQMPGSYDVELEVFDAFKAFYDALERGGLGLSAALKSALMPGRLGQYVAYILVATLIVILYVAIAF